MKFVLGVVFLVAFGRGFLRTHDLESLEVTQVTEGFLSSILLDSSKDCVQNYQGVVSELQTAVHLLPESTSGAFQKASEVSQLLKNCSQGKNYPRLGVPIQLNYIYQEIKDCILAKSWFDLGYNLGLLVNNQETQRVLLVIEGFFEGMALEMKSSEVIPCITDLNQITASIEQAVSDFELKTFKGVRKGISDLAEAFSIMPQAMKLCTKSTHETANTVEKVLEEFRSPWSLLYHVGKAIVLDGHNIYSELSGAITAWKHQDWFKCGVDLGEAMFAFIKYGEKKPEPTHIALGILNGMEIPVDHKELEPCLSFDSEKFLTGLASFEKNTFDEALEGLDYFAEGIKSIPLAIRKCKQEHSSEAFKLENAYRALKEPNSLVWGDLVLLNGKEVYLKHAILNLKVEDWYNFGVHLGRTLLSVHNSL